MRKTALRAALVPTCLLMAVLAAAPPVAVAGDRDPRLRTALYSADEVYRLPAYIGYQIDLEFEPGEHFVGLAAGDAEALVLAAQANHLFIKPKAPNVRTNLTVLTNRRTYRFDYATLSQAPSPDHADVIYVLRFIYPTALPTSQRDATVPAAAAPLGAASPQAVLARASLVRSRNTDYWYCGRPELQPLAVWDDGVQTHLRFGPRTELPALFVRNDDGSESLVNFHVEQGELVVHRIARRFVLRRGRLVGCIVNKGFAGAGVALPSGTLSPEIQRALREPDHEAIR